MCQNFKNFLKVFKNNFLMKIFESSSLLGFFLTGNYYRLDLSFERHNFKKQTVTRGF